MSITETTIQCMDYNTYQPQTFPVVRVPPGPSCPDASWTLSGTTCTRPDPCTAGDVVSFQAFGGWSVGKGPLWGAPTSTMTCDGQCTVQVTASAGCSGTQGTVDSPQVNWCNVTGTKTGGQCTASPIEPGAVPAIPQHAPPCAEGEGVATSSTGKVLCVPEGTPAAEPPKVGKKEETKTNPDGSSSTTTTITTCTGAGSCSSTTTINNTGAGGGSGPGAVPGQAGPVGTTTQQTDTKADEGTPDPEGCDPTKQMCSAPGTSGLYTKKTETMAGPLTRFAEGVRNSTMGSNATGFFSVTVPTGSCPDWSASVNVLGGTFGVDMRPVFCSQTALSMMNVIGTVLMAVAAFAAFKWAIL